MANHWPTEIGSWHDFIHPTDSGASVGIRHRRTVQAIELLKARVAEPLRIDELTASVPPITAKHPHPCRIDQCRQCQRHAAEDDRQPYVQCMHERARNEA